MKKFFKATSLLLVAIMLIIAMAGCSDKDTSTSTSSTDTSKAESSSNADESKQETKELLSAEEIVAAMKETAKKDFPVIDILKTVACNGWTNVTIFNPETGNEQTQLTFCGSTAAISVPTIDALYGFDITEVPAKLSSSMYGTQGRDLPLLTVEEEANMLQVLSELLESIDKIGSLKPNEEVKYGSFVVLPIELLTVTAVTGDVVSYTITKEQLRSALPSIYAQEPHVIFDLDESSADVDDSPAYEIKIATDPDNNHRFSACVITAFLTNDERTLTAVYTVEDDKASFCARIEDSTLTITKTVLNGTECYEITQYYAATDESETMLIEIEQNKKTFIIGTKLEGAVDGVDAVQILYDGTYDVTDNSYRITLSKHSSFEPDSNPFVVVDMHTTPYKMSDNPKYIDVLTCTEEDILPLEQYFYDMGKALIDAATIPDAE